MSEEKPKNTRFTARALEVIYNGHQNGKEILSMLRKKKWGLYKGFVKWHLGNEEDDGKEFSPHTHVSIILWDSKPQIPCKNNGVKEYFKFNGALPKKVDKLGKGNTSPLKKMAKYVAYLVDGHDNGGAGKDVWNYKYDYELMQCKDDAKILLLLSRGKSMRQIIDEADWNFKAYIFKNKTSIDKMVNNWRKHNRDDTVYHELEEFTKEARDAVQGWNPATHTLVLQGDSNMGKTELAKALLKSRTKKNPIFCSNLNKLSYRDTHQPLILDDMNLGGISRSKAIALTDIENDRDIRILFGIHTIEAGTARIFTTNESREDFLPGDSHGAIDRRVLWVNLSTLGRLY